MNLCFPYASVYMIALGLRDTQIGLVATVYILSQVAFAFFSGPITDKIGRRKATAFFDFIAWCIPCLIWWQAQGFMFFFVAALLNGAMQVTMNSWDCLLIEDAEKSEITKIYSLVIVMGQLCAFFAPISSVLVSRLTLIPAIRILYINAFVLMTIKIVVLYLMSRETQTGLIKIKENQNRNIFQLAAGYGEILKIIIHSKGIVFSIAITVLVRIVGTLNTTFWQVIASKKLLVPDPMLPLFPIVKSIVAIIFLFLVVPRLSKGLLKLPLLVGFACYFIGQAILILIPPDFGGKYILLGVSLVFDGFGFGTLDMLAVSLIAIHIHLGERARVMAILNMIIMTAVSPFPWIGGMLSDISRNFPFILNLCLLVAGILVTFVYYRKGARELGVTL
jgi:MFS family permease